MPAPNALRRISTGVYAISKPTNGRHSYLGRELAALLGVNESSVSRWIGRGYIKADKARGFWTITVDEAMRFSREGPRAGTPPSGPGPRRRDPATNQFIKSAPP